MSTREHHPLSERTFPSDVSSGKSLAFSRRPDIELALRPPDSANLKKLLVQVTGRTDTESVARVKIKVVTRHAGLHRLADLTPRLRVLVLDGSCVDSLRDLGSSLRLLETLSVVGCSLKSLDGLSGFRSLNALIARGNSIKSPAACSLVRKLARLDLADNEIDDIDSFAFLRNCRHLRILDVAGNSFDNYRNTIKALLPQIRILDGEDVVGAVGEKEISRGNESDLTSEDEDDLASSLEDEECSFLPAGEIETNNDSRINEPNAKIVSEHSKNQVERNLDPLSTSIFLLTHDLDGLSMVDLNPANIGDNNRRRCPEIPANKLMSVGRAICGNLAASLRARNPNRNPFTLAGGQLMENPISVSRDE